MEFNFTPEEMNEFMACEASIFIKRPHLDLSSLTESLSKDPEFFYAWQATIAESFQDAYYTALKDRIVNNVVEPFDINVHLVSNEAARNFLNTLVHAVKNRG